jgi:hypothetical protein
MSDPTINRETQINANQFLICSDKNKYIENFCGQTASTKSEVDALEILPDSHVFLAGDVATIFPWLDGKGYWSCSVVTTLSTNYIELCQAHHPHIQCITQSQVPLNIHNAGLFVPNFFEPATYFQSITTEHQFQSLTESNKPGAAYRTGIYLCDVQTAYQKSDEEKKCKTKMFFHLLRCSTNLGGPTDNFRVTDKKIVSAVQQFCNDYFREAAPLNHVLAQVYHNQPDRKAKISAHSDKTKDMPPHGVLAFCTFYDRPVESESELTQLRFRLKKQHGQLPNEFCVTLYPNSLFVIPLSTNRLYTHEIKPSQLPADKVPTRLGYVIRCSDTTAMYCDGLTFIRDKTNNSWGPLRPITEEDRASLKQLYYQENSTQEQVFYPHMPFSMNQGDYQQPNL